MNRFLTNLKHKTMNIDKMIEQWEEKHSSLLNEYSKGNANNEVMQLYRSQMKNVLDFIDQLKQVKNFFIPDVSQRSELLLSAICQFTKRNKQKEIQEVEKWIETDFRK